MTRSLRIHGGRVLGLKDGVSFFDTDAYPVQFLPEEYGLSVTGQTVSFPDLTKGICYGYSRGTIGPDLYIGCHSYAAIDKQYWGPPDVVPVPDGGYELADTVLGTVPDWADALLIKLKLTRTSDPDQIFGNDIPVNVKEGQWITLADQAVVLERLYPLARMIEITLADADNGDGTRNVILRRRQSTNGQDQAFYLYDNATNAAGWSYHGGTRAMYPVYSIEGKGPSFDPSGIGSSTQYGQAGQCSTTDPTDYSSTYSVDLEITPGKFNIDPASTVTDGPYFYYLGDKVVEASSSTITFSDMPLGPDLPNRRVFALVDAFHMGGSTALGISGVTIDGVSAAAVIAPLTRDAGTGTNSQHGIVGIYEADISSDTIGDVVITGSATIHYARITLIAGYNIESITPDDYLSTNYVDTDFSLDTVDGGIVLAVFSMGNSYYANLQPTGLDNPVGVVFTTSTTPFVTSVASYGAAQDADGSTLTLRLEWDVGNDPSDRPIWDAWQAVSLH